MPKVLAAFAHPDDIELLCAGTLRLLVEAGWELRCLTLSGGDRGGPASSSREQIRTTRLAEAAEAARVLGGSFDWAGLDDMEIAYSPQQLPEVIDAIRRFGPDLVITHSPDCYHLDHEETARLVQAACFGSRNRHYQTPSPPVLRPALYYADATEGKDKYGHPVQAAFWIDVTSVFEDRQRAVSCHHSQGRDDGGAHLRAVNQRRGRMHGERCGVMYAEGFRQHLGHHFPQQDVLGEALRGYVRGGK
jgi:LmbE family N-acetylglucosaminyl deacetylase